MLGVYQIGFRSFGIDATSVMLEILETDQALVPTARQYTA